MIPLLLHELFPEGVSDETAYQFVHFFEQLTAELDAHYFAQVKRYLDDQQPGSPAIVHSQNKDDDDGGGMPF